VSGNVTALAANGPYVVTCMVTVAKGATLTIQPGTVIKFASGAGLVVEGTLVAQGTSTSPIYFTSLKDDTVGGDTNGDGNATSPAPGDWNTIASVSGGSATISYATIRYGGSTATSTKYPLVYVDSTSTLSLDQSTVSESGYVGIAPNQTANLSITNSTIANNLGAGLDGAVSQSLTVNNSTIQSNSGGGIELINPAAVTLTDDTFTGNAKFSADLSLTNSAATVTASGNTATSNAINGIVVVGTANTSTLDGDPNLAYITSGLTVNANQTLTIGAGTILKFGPSAQLTINGTFTGNGTAASPIYLTSYKDDAVGGDTNNDGANLPAAGDWRGISVSTGGNATLTDATIRYAGAYTGCSGTCKVAQVTLNGGSFSVANGAITNGASDGINGTSSALTVTNNTISDNTGAAATIPMPSQSATIDNNNGSGNGSNAINLSGTVGGAGTYSLGGSNGLPFVLSSIAVNSGSALNVTGGAVVKFQPNGYLVVNGTLQAQGTAANPIYFTSIKDDTVGGDTNGDGNASSPAPGDWEYVYVSSGASANFAYTTVRYGGYDWIYDYGSLYVDQNSALSFDHGTISNSKFSGIATNPNYSAASLSVTNSTIANNGSYGIYADAPTFTLTNDTVANNVSSGVNLTAASSTTVTPTLTLTNSTFTGNSGYAAVLSFNNSGTTLDLSGNSVTGNGADGFYLSGNVNTTTLPANPGVAYVISSLTIPTGQTLTVSPGAVVKFQPNGYLVVNGTLQAQGTAANPIYFTSIKDDTVGGDTNGDGNASSPAPGDWEYVYVSSGASANFAYTTVRYGGYDWIYDYGSLYVDQNSALSFDHGTISNSKFSGIATNPNYSAASLSVTNSTIANNGSYGMDVGATTSSSITGSNIYGNGGYGVYNANPSVIINAPNNYWGSPTGPSPHGSGNAINYQSCYNSTTRTYYDCGDYVDVYPWIGMSTTLGQSGPASSYQAYVAEPVNTANGNYSYVHTFLAIPTRGLPLEFGLAYNALAPQNGSVGFGWTHSWNDLLTVNADSSVTVTFGDGHGERWTLNGSVYVGDPGIYGLLTKNGDGSYDLTEKDYTNYHFDSSGKLLWEQDRNLNRTSLIYDGQGRLSTVTSPDGRTLGFAYASPVSSTLISQVTDPLGRTVTLAYDTNGNLTAITDPTNATTSVTYDANHRVLSVTDANLRTFVTNTYDAIGRVSQQLDALTNKTTFVYDDTNHKTVVTDPLNNTTTYQYDTLGRLTSVTDALSHTVSYVYDANNNQTRVTDKRGNATNFSYDARGNVLSITDPLNAVTTFVWDITNGKNNLTSRTDANSHTTSYQYDANNNLLQKTDPLGNVTSYTYGSYGELAALKDANNHTTTYGYDAYGDRNLTTDPLNNQTSAIYDAGGRKSRETDANGNTASYTYDADNRVLTIADPLNDDTTYTYDAVGNRLTVTDANNHTTIYGYDNKDRLSSITDPLNNLTQLTYDANNNPLTVVDPLNRTTSKTYDALNRVSTIADSLGDKTSYTYDPNGNRLTMTDPNNNKTTYSYDADNRLQSVTDAANGVVSYSYDAVGNRLTVTDANLHTTTSTYDKDNRLASTKDPDNSLTSYTYDGVGNLITKSKPDGTPVSYTYDGDNRLSTVSAPGLSISEVYDKVGNRATLVDSTGTTQFNYDVLNRLTSVTYPDTRVVGYGYDKVGNRTSIVYPGNLTVSYVFDAANRLISVTDWSGKLFSYGYDAASETSSLSYPNGTSASYGYDGAGRVNQITDQNGTSTFASFGYTYDGNGNRKSEVATSGTSTYGYDVLNRLTSASYPGGTTIGYAYDPTGNRTTLTTNGTPTSYSYDAGDRLQSAGSASYTWDANGRIATRTSSGTTTTYSFDPLDRLIGLTGTSSVSYSYNGDGVRVGKTVGTTTTSYLQDLQAALPLVLIETTNSQNTDYVYGKGLLEQVKPDGTRNYAHADALGSTRVLTDDNGNVVATYDYDAFGAVRSQSGTATSSFTFDGEQTDPESGLVFLRARYYEPATGRFLGKDPAPLLVSATQGVNRYTFGGNNPIRITDPTGKFNALQVDYGALTTLGGVATLAGAVGVATVGAALCTTGIGCAVTVVAAAYAANQAFVAGQQIAAGVSAIAAGSQEAPNATIQRYEPLDPLEKGSEWGFGKIGTAVGLPESSGEAIGKGAKQLSDIGIGLVTGGSGSLDYVLNVTGYGDSITESVLDIADYFTPNPSSGIFANSPSAPGIGLPQQCQQSLA